MLADVVVTTAVARMFDLLDDDRETVNGPDGVATITRFGDLRIAVEPADGGRVFQAPHRIFVGLALGLPPVRTADVLVPDRVVGNGPGHTAPRLLGVARAVTEDEWLPEHYAPVAHFGVMLARPELGRAWPKAIGVDTSGADGSLLVYGAVGPDTDTVRRADAADAAASFTLAVLRRLVFSGPYGMPPPRG